MRLVLYLPSYYFIPRDSFNSLLAIHCHFNLRKLEFPFFLFSALAKLTDTSFKPKHASYRGTLQMTKGKIAAPGGDLRRLWTHQVHPWAVYFPWCIQAPSSCAKQNIAYRSREDEKLSRPECVSIETRGVQIQTPKLHHIYINLLLKILECLPRSRYRIARLSHTPPFHPVIHDK